ncbi:ABC transporter permease [Streptomyces smyrnaeus]|uniref:ABC transporter permease n=1 Tax=Streptomyces smyrnaeus TaxID=1387713 RepID=UPI0033B1EB9B
MSALPTAVGARPRRAELLRRELRTVHAVVLRDLLRTVGQPVYSGMMLLEPLVFLLALGGGLAAFTLTAVTTALAVAIRTPETFEVVLNLAMTPLLFLSGAFFPLTKLPDWLAALAALNPLSYAVDLLHRTIEATSSHTAAHAGVRWADWTPLPC